MNIFILDDTPKRCAQQHCDKHVVKMILETAQILSTAHVIIDDNQIGYKPTHINHPCTQWCCESRDNYDWLFELFEELCLEYKYRYGREHLSWIKYKNVLGEPPENIRWIGQTDFVQAMPDTYKNSDPIQAYRNYYVNEKSNLLQYTRRLTPEWIYNV